MTENGKLEIKEKQNNGTNQFAWSQEIPNYGDKLLKRLDEFRKSTILYDVRLRAEGGEFNAHKVILAACGGIFRTCFIDEKTKMISSSINDILIDCPAQGIKPIIRFAYSGSLVITNRVAVSTMKAAEVTKMREVQEICADIAIKEYGWIIDNKNDVNENLIEKLRNVLQLHADCFPDDTREELIPKKQESSVHITGNISDALEKSIELPYLEEVNTHFPDLLSRYEKLALCLRKANEIISKSANKSADKSLNTDAMKKEIKSLPNNEKSSESVLPKVTESAESSNNDIAPVSPVKKQETHVEEMNVTPNKKQLTAPVKPKPRASLKKSAPPPPPTKTANTSPVRSKQPGKIPPPRPKPPVKKKISNDEDSIREATEKKDDYDDNLNPFA